MASNVKGLSMLGVALFSAALAAACGGDDDDGSGASGGRAGSGATGGQAGNDTGGTAGSSGRGGTGGSSAGGAAGTDGGGASGAGGSGGGAGGSGGTGNDGGSGKGFPVYPEVPYPSENQHTDDKAMLGKILFWDEQMGGDNTVACGTCHRGEAGGSDPRGVSGARHAGPDGDFGTADDIHGAPGVKRCEEVGGNVTYKSDPIYGLGVQVTKRRPPTYLDAMFAPDIFWDGRAKTKFTDPDTGQVAIVQGGGLESQAVGPPLSDVEMACENRTWAMIHTKLLSAAPLARARNLPNDIREALAKYPTYPKLFEAAFGTTEINTKRIAFAIATHERRLKSDQTPWDRWNAGDDSAMTAAQVRGFELFRTTARCNVCHSPPLFTDGLFHNLGFIAADFDIGRQAISGVAADKGKFKTPTLRNVGLREPGGLLHFGFGHGASLEAVMDAYNVPPNLENTDSEILALDLTSQELDDIVDFMRNGLTDPRVKNETAPFDRPTLSTEP